MGIFDFNNNRAQNLSDPKFDKDAINLRTLNRRLNELEGDTVSATVSGITAGANIQIVGTTSAITISLSGNVNTSSVFASSLSGTNIFSGSSNLNQVFASKVHTHSISDITNLSARLNTKADLSGATFTGIVEAPSLNATTLSGGTIYSGATDLSDIFSQFASSLGNFLPLSGGTVSGTSKFSIISATTLSASTIFVTILSGMSPINIENVIVQNGTLTASSISASTVSADTVSIFKRSYNIPIVSNATSAQTVDWSLTNNFDYTLSANTTFTFSNNINGQSIVMAVTQNSTTSGYTSSFSAGTITIKWQNGITPVQTATTGKTDIFTFIQSNDYIFGSYIQNF